jgi:hypothetical protein
MAAWRMAKLREAGLITWPSRPGKRSRPGRAAGSYAPGTDRQAIEALGLIRSKMGQETAAAVLYVRGWPVSLAARRRFARRWLALFVDAFPKAISAAISGDPKWWAEVESSQSEPVRVFQSLFGGHALDVVEWLSYVFAGDATAIENPHPDIVPALRLDPWAEDGVDYADREFVDPDPPISLIEQVRRWAVAGQTLTDPEARAQLESALDDEDQWERARVLVRAFLDSEKMRRAVAETLPMVAEQAQIPMARIFTAARRQRTIDVRSALLLLFCFMTRLDDSLFQESLSWHETRRAQLTAVAVLGRDCPARWRKKLDELIFTDEPQY